MEPTLETAPGGAPLSNPQPNHAKANVGMSELGPTLVLTSEDGNPEIGSNLGADCGSDAGNHGGGAGNLGGDAGFQALALP